MSCSVLPDPRVVTRLPAQPLAFLDRPKSTCPVRHDLSSIACRIPQSLPAFSAGLRAGSDSSSPAPRRPRGIERTSHLAMARSGHRRRHGQSRPARAAAAAAAARVGSRSLARMFATWRCTVCGLSTRRSAICGSLRPCATSPSTSRSRCTELTQHAGVGRARRRGRALDPEKRRDGAQDSVPVAVPRQVGIARQRHQVGVRQQRGYLACASQPHRAVVLTMHDERRRANPRQLVAHVGLVDQREQIGSDLRRPRRHAGRR